MIGNYVRTAAIGLFNGLMTMTKAEKDSQRALEEDDKRRAEEQIQKEKYFRKRMKELKEIENERFREEQDKRLKAEEALDHVLTVGGHELLQKIYKNNEEYLQAPSPTNLEKKINIYLLR